MGLATQGLISHGQEAVHTDVAAEEFRVGDPEDARHVGQRQRLEIVRAGALPGPVVHLVGHIEHGVVAQVKAGRRQRRALDAFNAGNVMGVGLGLERAGNGRQRGGEETANDLGFHWFWLLLTVV